MCIRVHAAQASADAASVTIACQLVIHFSGFSLANTLPVSLALSTGSKVRGVCWAPARKISPIDIYNSASVRVYVYGARRRQCVLT